MAQIYQNAAGASVYDNNGQTFDAHTGQAYAPPAPAPNTATRPAPNDSHNADYAKFGSVTPEQAAQPAQEPAVISSSNIDQVAADTKQKYQTLSQKGTYQGIDGNLYYSDGSLVPAPTGAQNDGSGWMDPATGAHYAVAPDYVNAGEDPDLQKINDLMAGLKSSSDAATKMQLDAIHQQFDQLRTEQQDVNSRTNATRQSALLASGESRYAPLDEAGTMNAQMTFGLSAIAKLDAQENAALAQAKAAQDSNNMKLMDQAMATVQTARTQKQAAAQKLIEQQQQLMADQQKKRDVSQAQATQAARDTQVADIVQSGLTDPAQILQALNYDKTGKQIGNYTAAEVSSTLKAIAENTGAAGIKGLTGDVGNFYTLKNTPGALPASILALPAEKQLAAYISMVNQAKKGTVSPASGAASSGGATQPAGASVVKNPVPVVGFDPANGPNQQDQAQFLAALPGGEHGPLATTIAGLTDYSINPATFPTRLLKGQSGLTRADAVTLAKQYDPSYNENNFTAAASLQKSITSGNYSQAIASANTLIQHLKKMNDDAQQMPNFTINRNFPGVGKIATFLGGAFHNPALNNFKIDAGAVATEAAKIYKSTGAPATTEIEDWQRQINPDMSPGEVKGAMDTIVELMAGKLSSISNNYQQTLGKPYTKALLTPQSVQILKDMGIDPTTVDPMYSASPTAQMGNSSSLSSFLSSAPGSPGAGAAPINWAAATI